MNLLRRIGLYLAGFSLGLVLITFFFKEKGTTFCYLPNCRTLKDLRSKPLELSENIMEYFSDRDSLARSEIVKILTYGHVDFSSSTTKSEPCKRYTIDMSPYRLTVESRDDKTLAKKLSIIVKE